MLPPGKPRFFWLVVALGLIGLGYYAFAASVLIRFGSVAADPGWRAERLRGGWAVGYVDPDGVAQGQLRTGERIVAIDGDPLLARISPNLAVRLVGTASTYSLRVSDGSREREVRLTIQERQAGGGLRRALSLIAVSLAFFAVGLLMGLSKPDDYVTQLGCLTGVSVAVHMVGLSVAPMRSFLTGAGLVLYTAVAYVPFHFALGYDFFSRFPFRPAESRAWIWLRRAIYTCCLLIFLPRAALNGLTLLSPEGRGSLAGPAAEILVWYFDHNLGPEVLFFAGAAAATVFVLARNRRHIVDRGQRLRHGWVVVGVAAGLAPTAMYGFLLLLARAPTNTNAFETLAISANLATVAMPLIVGYAVIKHRVLGIELIVRRGMQYLLARNVLRFMALSPLLLLALHLIWNRDRTVAEVLVRGSVYFYVGLTATAAASLKYRGQLQRWLDRRFFREAYDQEQILLELIERIKQADSVEEIARLVTAEVDAALHPACVYVFYRRDPDRDLVLGHASSGSGPELRVPAGSELARFLEARETACDFPFAGRAPIAEGDIEWLVRLGVRLIVPVTGSARRLSGFLLLGEKMSEEIYSSSDRKLLQSMAGQIAIACENIWLKQRVSEEQRIREDVLARLQGEGIRVGRECPACGACYDDDVRRCERDGSELTVHVPVERVVEGKYRLDRLIGRGGSGAVYEALDLRLRRQVAVKVLIGRPFGENLALRRFEREAQASARLAHPNIITVYDYGIARPQVPYLVMEFLPGFTWRSELRRLGALAPARAATWFDQLLTGLHAAHASGVIHRDLKPENVLVLDHGASGEFVKILDFGLAKIRLIDLHEAESLTLAGTVIGTAGYMSPEQFTGRAVDERTDIFSVGVMLAETLTGRRPFSGRTPTELLRSLLHDAYHLPGDAAAVMELDGILQCCLAKEPTRRFPSVAALRTQLIPAIRRCPPFRAAVADTNASTASWMGRPSVS